MSNGTSRRPFVGNRFERDPSEQKMRASGYLQCSVGIPSSGDHEVPGAMDTVVRPSELNPDAGRLQAAADRVDPQVMRWEEQRSGLDMMRKHEAEVGAPQTHAASCVDWESSCRCRDGGGVRRSNLTKRCTDATT